VNSKEIQDLVEEIVNSKTFKIFAECSKMVSELEKKHEQALGRQQDQIYALEALADQNRPCLAYPLYYPNCSDWYSVQMEIESTDRTKIIRWELTYFDYNDKSFLVSSPIGQRKKIIGWLPNRETLCLQEKEKDNE
jgi:hypothetical protein